jgi:hypothetical protein
MAANILETTDGTRVDGCRERGLIVESSRSQRRDADYRRQIAALSRAIEARDRLIITAARWLSRPLPAMCSHLEELARTSTDSSNAMTTLETCDEHLAAVTRLSRGLDEIASFCRCRLSCAPKSSTWLRSPARPSRDLG